VQEVQGRMRMVARRSFAFGMVRVAMTPGMAQAYPERRGRKDFPLRPTLFMMPSMR